MVYFILKVLFVFVAIITGVFFFATPLDCLSGVTVQDRAQCANVFSTYIAVTVVTFIMVFFSTIRRQRKRLLWIEEQKASPLS